jgi:hypothetical protein
VVSGYTDVNGQLSLCLFLLGAESVLSFCHMSLAFFVVLYGTTSGFGCQACVYIENSVTVNPDVG